MTGSTQHLRTSALLALALGAGTFFVSSAPGQSASSAPAQQRQPPADAPLVLNNALPEDAFAALGARHGAQFGLVEGQWLDAESGVRINADLSMLTFWQAVVELADQTSYEPVFQPYGRSQEGRPIVWLRRVDVRGEERMQTVIAAGPLLVRSPEARVTVDLKLAQLRLISPQFGVRTQILLEPNVPATYVTAAATRAWDEEDAQLKRGAGHDPTAGVRDGMAELLLRFDIVKRIPREVAKWQALLRVVEATRTEMLEAPLKCVPEIRRHGVVARPQGRLSTISTQPATVPAPVPVDVHVLGPYEVRLEAVRLGEREIGRDDRASGRQPPRIATLSLVIPRGALDHTAWSRLYGFLVATPPEIRHLDASVAGNWRLIGYAVVATPSADEPDVAGSFRVWAQYEADAELADPARLLWALPVASEEQRHQVIWEKSLEILPPSGRSTTRPQGRQLPEKPGGEGGIQEILRED